MQIPRSLGTLVTKAVVAPAPAGQPATQAHTTWIPKGIVKDAMDLYPELHGRRKLEGRRVQRVQAGAGIAREPRRLPALTAKKKIDKRKCGQFAKKFTKAHARRQWDSAVKKVVQEARAGVAPPSNPLGVTMPPMEQRKRSAHLKQIMKDLSNLQKKQKKDFKWFERHRGLAPPPEALRSTAQRAPTGRIRKEAERSAVHAALRSTKKAANKRKQNAATNAAKTPKQGGTASATTGYSSSSATPSATSSSSVPSASRICSISTDVLLMPYICLT